jgi:phosphonate transport system substrate-binding protein
MAVGSKAARGLSRRQALAWLAVLPVVATRSSPGREANPRIVPFRVAFSTSMFAEVNENDARAAVKIWGQTVAKERGIPTEAETRVLKGITELRQALRAGLVDGVAMTTVEYAQLKDEVRFDPIFVTVNAGRATEEYVLLVHEASKMSSLADLRGRRLGFHSNPRACLAQPWLDTLLVRNGFKPAAEFAGTITQNSKLPRAVLPVFFRQSDACVVTRSGFETMCELNPQLAQQLKVIATSPEVIPGLFCFRADYRPPFRDQLLANVCELHRNPAGQQMLTLFLSERIEERPASCLSATLELLAEHARLCGPGAETAIAPALRPETASGGRVR